MARPKNPLTVLVESKTLVIVEKILNGDLPQIDRMRQIWYTMKGHADVVALRPDDLTDKQWEEKVGAIVTKTVEVLAKDDLSVYDDLGLKSKAFTPNDDEIPIILFTEKMLTVFDRMVGKYGMATYSSRGQLPIFEAYLMSKYLDNTIYNEAFMFVLTDRDPAGESIFENVKNKMHKFTTDTNMNIVHVMINEDEAEHFETYPLTDNTLNAEWIARGDVTGVEIDNLENVEKILGILLDRIEKHLDPRLYVKKSKETFIQKEHGIRVFRNKKMRKWRKKRMKLFNKSSKKEEKILEKVKLLDTDFSYDNTDVLGFNTYIRNSENTDMNRTDLHFYQYLLGEHNPYNNDLIELYAINKGA